LPRRCTFRSHASPLADHRAQPEPDRAPSTIDRRDGRDDRDPTICDFFSKKRKRSDQNAAQRLGGTKKAKGALGQ
jgi:hypothetical protein